MREQAHALVAHHRQGVAVVLLRGIHHHRCPLQYRPGIVPLHVHRFLAAHEPIVDRDPISSLSKLAWRYHFHF